MIEYTCFTMTERVATASRLQELLNRYVSPGDWIVCAITPMEESYWVISAYRHVPDPAPNQQDTAEMVDEDLDKDSSQRAQVYKREPATVDEIVNRIYH